MTILQNAIKILRPDVGFGIGNEADWDTIQMSDGSVRPTDGEISAVWEEASKNSAIYVLREERNRLIALTDWRFRSDLSPSQAWIDYCQALRDLPQNSSPELDENGNLINVQWPEIPQ